jgi:hypothetical protein
MDQRPIMVVVGEKQWTLQAVHLAAARARATGAEVILIKMVAVGYPGYLGSPYGSEPLSQRDYDDLQAYHRVCESYAAPHQIVPFQYISLGGAIADAAEQLNAESVFASVPDSIIPYWHRYQVWSIRRQLDRHGCALYTLEPPAGLPNGSPSVATATRAR